MTSEFRFFLAKPGAFCQSRLREPLLTLWIRLCPPGRYLVTKKKRPDDADPYAQRLNELGLDLPEPATSNKAAMQSIARFLIEHKVFETEEATLKGIAQDVGPNEGGAEPS